MCTENTIYSIVHIWEYIKPFLAHPNTPAYIQSIAVIIATVMGFKYLKKKIKEKKLDLIIRTYKYCLETYSALACLKQPPPLLANNASVQEYESIDKKQFAKIVSSQAASYLDVFNANAKLFSNLYGCYAEMRLFFNKNTDLIKPIENLLWTAKRIGLLLRELENSKSLMESLVEDKHDRVVSIIRNGLVQMWENIELTDEQKDYESKRVEVEGAKGFRKFYYLDNMLDRAKDELDKHFPKLISKAKF